MDSVTLVTGGGGFVGTHTALYLLENTRGHVVVLDSFERSDPRFIESLRGQYGRRLAVEKAPLEDTHRVSEIMSSNRVSEVMHCAAYIDIPEGQAPENRRLYEQKIYGNTKSLLEAMQQSSVRRLCFSSTAAVYGPPQASRVDEHGRITEDHPLNPTTVYGEYKVLSENAMVKAFEDGRLDAVTLFRYFNVAGADPKNRVGEAHLPREGHALPLIILAALGVRDDFTIFGNMLNTRDGTPVRDLIHVLDLAKAHAMGIRQMRAGRLEGLNVFNLGNVYDDPSKLGVTVREMVEAVKNRLGGFTVKETEQLRSPGEPAVLCASSDKAVKWGWRPQYTLDDIVDTATAWHMKLAADGWYKTHNIGKPDYDTLRVSELRT
jgi:UDP-glucose 4-epimerase